MKLASLALKFFVVFFLGLCALTKLRAATVWLDELDLSQTSQGWGTPQTNKSVGGHALRIGGKEFAHGLGTHAESVLHIDLIRDADRFTAMVGVDDETKETAGSVEFSIMGDDRVLWQSGVMKGGDPAKPVDLNLKGLRYLVLSVGDAGDGINSDHADWADAKFEISGRMPFTTPVPKEDAMVLTPPGRPKPRINFPRIYGVRPKHPVLFTVPASGARPMMFSATNLPPGLELDSASGRITGSLADKGEHEFTIRATNAAGFAEAKIRIICGEQIALTPPLGWNSWNCFAQAVDDAKVRAAADAMVASGLIQHGWSYINIDDCWEGKRDATGRIRPNEKFPDLKALADYVHSKGLKIGIYSSPGPKTCAGFEASWQHEELDAQQYAEWGFDYLKYDWCSYERVQDRSLPERERLMKPYTVMHEALAKQNRDIVFSLCQYGMGRVWEWGAEVGGNCWRTTGDISDSWGSMAGIGFNQAGHEKFAGPGHWNDPDMLVVGRLGWGQLRPTRLTPNEQYTHITLWALLAAPLLIGCDMSQLDEFTLNLLSNDDVLEVNQDYPGKQAARVVKEDYTEIWTKEMSDGSHVAGLFNRGPGNARIQLPFSIFGLQGTHRVRDLWRQRELGSPAGVFNATLPRHGALLLRVW